jgi:hypothetical protein
VASVVSSELEGIEAYEFVDPTLVKRIMTEQQLSVAELVKDRASMQRLGRLVGADLIIQGTVRFAATSEGRIGAGFGRIGAVGASAVTFDAALALQVINVQTGEVVSADSGSRSIMGRGANLKSSAAEAMQAATVAGLQGLPNPATLATRAAASPVSGTVVSVAGSRIILSLDSTSQPIPLGTVLTVMRLNGAIRDPDSRTVLSDQLTPVATAVVMKVDGRVVTAASSEVGSIRPGDVIILER